MLGSLRKPLLAVSVVFILVTPVAAFGPWSGRVINVDTKEPVENAVVLAVWWRVDPQLGDDAKYFHKAVEILTTKTGYFEVPPYTPDSSNSIVKTEGPVLEIFKPGYTRVSISGEYLQPNFSKEKKASWEGSEVNINDGHISLTRLNSNEERRRQLYLPVIPGSRMPRYLNLYNQESEFLGSIPLPTPSTSSPGIKPMIISVPSTESTLNKITPEEKR